MADTARRRDEIAFLDDLKAQEDFRSAVIRGLSRKDKSIPCRFLYDAAGSTLFDRICETPEYYLTRTELDILSQCARSFAAQAGTDCTLIELGSGSGHKVRILLDALQRPRGYVGIDVSRDHLQASAFSIARRYPAIKVSALCADYTKPLELPVHSTTGRRVVFFPGSTIGNLMPEEARSLLTLWASQIGAGGGMLIGVDLKKETAVLHAAYNDAGGVTAAFTKNILVRANRELGTNFSPAHFEHEAFYAPDEGRVEIYLRSVCRQTARLDGHVFEFAPGERIHVEYSYKYDAGEFVVLAEDAGFTFRTSWTDPQKRFALYYLEAC